MKNLALAVSAIFFLSMGLYAHGNQEHLIGTVARVDGTSIVVKTTAGAEKTVTVGEKTKFVKGSSPATIQDVKAGDRVVIHARPEGKALQATEVRIGTASGAEAKH